MNLMLLTLATEKLMLTRYPLEMLLFNELEVGIRFGQLTLLVAQVGK